MSRLISLAVAGIYISIAYFCGEAFEAFTVVLGISLIVGLSCIWFGDELGGMLGYMGHASISSTTPGNVVRFIGWIILLFLPVLSFLLKRTI